MDKFRFLSNRQIILRILFIILSIDFAVMMLLELLHIDIHPLITALLDTLLLASLSTPGIYLWVIIPLSKSRIHAIAEIRKLAMTDSLTQLPNRRHLDKMLHLEFGRQLRSGREFSLLMLDIDEFKGYNDHYGHLQGDECLRHIAQVLSSHACRSTDLAARYGGEEFICLLPETDIDGAMVIAESIRQDIEDLHINHEFSRVSQYVTVSIGVTSSKNYHATNAISLLAHVDQLLYHAKKKGRNRAISDGDIQDMMWVNPEKVVGMVSR